MKVSIESINKILVCKLCNGYFRECHTIPECMHSFCKGCLIQYFYSPKETHKKLSSSSCVCPTCNISLGQKPFSKIVYDRNIQAIVDKLFPKFSSSNSNDSFEASQSTNNESLVINNEESPPSAKKQKRDDNQTQLNYQEDIKIRLKLSSYGNCIDTRQVLPQLRRSLFDIKPSLTMRKLSDEIVKRISDISEDSVITTNDLLLYANGNCISSEEFNKATIQGIINKYFADQIESDLKAGIVKERYEIHYARKINE